MANILAIDLGSTQMKLMIINENVEILDCVSVKYPTKVRKSGWMEQETSDWERALKQRVLKLQYTGSMNSIEMISFSGHMSGIVCLDKCGKPLGPCIMLSDNRSQKQSENLMGSMGELVKNRTGNPINNAFSLPKLLWVKEESRIYDQVACWLSPKDYIRYCITGIIATEYTDAYNSLCIHKRTLDWDEEIIKESGLKREMFPIVHRPTDVAGYVTREAAEKYGLKEGIPVAVGGADMACAVLGSGMSEEGDTALTLGTCATFFSIVQEPDNGLYGQITYHPLVEQGKMYALGSHINGGAAVNWSSSILSEKGKIDYEMIAELSEKAHTILPGSNGVVTLPFLSGSGSPYFCASDRQHIIGMKMDTTREVLFHSQLEGIAYNLRQTLLAFQKISEVKKIMMAGGGIHIDIWKTIIRDVFGVPIEIFHNPDVSTIGAALLGGKALGVFESIEKIAVQKRKIIEILIPDEEKHKEYQRLYQQYLRIYKIMHQLDLRERYV